MGAKIIGYRGIGNKERVIISGHAFRKHKVHDLKPHHRRFHNLRQTVRRFRLHPMQRTRVEVQVAGQVKEIRTDKSGFFSIDFGITGISPGWHPYQLSWDHQGEQFHGEFCVADERKTGVISDIDDTLLVSHSTKMIRKLNLILFRNAYNRKPIPMIKKWYNHISDINHATHPDDFYYVSNSEWNLYDFLEDFFEHNQLPKGVFLLQHLKKGLRDLLSTGRIAGSHKLGTIRFLLRFFPHKPFILVGDNGQKDMDIYSTICLQHPDRIQGVMIRKLPYINNEYRFNSVKNLITDLNIPFQHFH
jgi:phosphatidate phosphatase APP1